MRRDIFQAIADPTRRAIIALIALQAMTPNAIAEHFDTTRQAVSKHLRILTECELVKQEHRGREIPARTLGASASVPESGLTRNHQPHSKGANKMIKRFLRDETGLELSEYAVAAALVALAAVAAFQLLGTNIGTKINSLANTIK